MFKLSINIISFVFMLVPALAFAGSIGLTLPPSVIQNIQQDVAAGQQGIEMNAEAQAAPQNEANNNYLPQKINKPAPKPQAPAKPDITDSTKAAENANNNVTLENQPAPENTAPSVPTGFSSADEGPAGTGSNMTFDYGF